MGYSGIHSRPAIEPGSAGVDPERRRSARTAEGTLMDRMPQFEGLRRRFLLAGAVGAAACLIGVFLDSARFYQSYLIAYFFWLGVALGCLPLLMLHHLVGGVWGFV